MSESNSISSTRPALIFDLDGTLQETESGLDLVLQREIDRSLDTVWAALTDPAKTAGWYGSWTGTPGAGNTITVVMMAEEGSPEESARITACTAPQHLGLILGPEGLDWAVDFHLLESTTGTTLTFTHHLDSREGVDDTGPGWEYYLDRLVASIHNDAFREWEEYYPAMSDYYRGLPVSPRS